MNKLISKKSNKFNGVHKSELDLAAGTTEADTIISCVDEDLLTVATWIQLNYID